MRIDKVDPEYYELLKRHLVRARKELQELREKIDKKILEIWELEEIIAAFEEKMNGNQV